MDIFVKILKHIHLWLSNEVALWAFIKRRGVKFPDVVLYKCLNQWNDSFHKRCGSQFSG